MISADGVVWHKSARYPGTFEVLDKKAKVQHRCSMDKPPVVLGEAQEGIRVKTLRPKVYEFACTHCGQIMRVSYEIYEQVKEHLPKA